MQRILNLTILLLCLVHISYSNSLLFVEEVDSLNLPTIQTKFYFFNDNVLPVTNLSNEDIVITSNSSTINNFNIINSSANNINNKKVLIYFDLSLDSTKKEHAINTITNLLKFNSPKQIEYYLIAFDKLNYNFRIGELDSAKLNSTLGRQEIEFISDIDFALNFEQNNPMDFLKQFNGDKEILVFSDSPIRFNNENVIFNNLTNNQISISFYNINNIQNNFFLDLAKKTNGFYINFVDSLYDASRILNAKLLRYSEAELNYDIVSDCEYYNQNEIKMRYYSNLFSFNVTQLDSLRPLITSDPLDINFANILPGDEDSQEIFVKSVNSNVNLYDIELSDDYGGIFTLFGGIDEDNDEPYLLRKGEEYPLQIRFNPTDSALVFTQIRIKSDACFGNNINITGGFPNTPPARKTLKLSYPNCPDTLFVNDDINVKWEGVLPRDVVQLEYSLNNGVSWDTLAKNVVNLEYEWKVPNIPTDEGMIRVLQLWPNNIGKTINLNHSQKQLNSAFFSPDGNYIVTSSDDGIVRVWNSNSSELVKEFRGHSDIVNYAIYSPNGEYIASSSRDGKAIVWHANPNDALFGEIYRSIEDHSGWVNSVDFNSQSNRIITSGQDGFFRIYNITNGSLVYEKNENQNVRFAKFAPNNEFYAVGLRNGISNIYNVNGNSLIKDFNTSVGGSNQSITHIDISPDSKLISFTNRLTKEISVWDYENKIKLKSFYHPPSLKDNYDLLETPNTSLFHFSNNDTLLITSAGNEAIRWDLTKNEGEDSTATFLEHTSIVINAHYNFDASRVVTSSWDGFAKIWRLKERDIQMDTNDCSFVIIDPTIQINDIELDYTLIGRTLDTTLVGVITNTSDVSILIDSINLRGRDRSEFNLKRRYRNILLSPNEELNLDLEFTPNEVGERQAAIEVAIPAKILNKDIKGFAYKEDVQQLNFHLDFGDLEIAESTELTQIPLIRNLDNNSLEIDSIRVYELDYDNFTYLSDNSNNSILNSGADLQSNLQFQTDTLGIFNSILKIYHKNEIQANKFLVSGIGVPPRVDTLNILIESQEVVNNQVVNCPLRVDKISNLGIVESISGFKILLSYNKSILEPLFSFDIVEDVGDIRTIELEVMLQNRENLLNQNAILSELNFRVALGKATFSELNIKSITPIGEGKIVLNWTNGIYNIIDICKEGGERLIDTHGKFELAQNYPNPVTLNSTIQFEIIEKGHTDLYIIDANGNKVKEIVNDNIPVGRYELNLDFTDLPNGTYFYVLESKNMKDTRRIIINK